MDAVTSTADGFRLSELDLELRGAGDFFGTRQHGLPALTIANLYRDMDILREAQDAAREVFADERSVPEAERGRIDARIARVLKAAGSAGTL